MHIPCIPRNPEKESARTDSEMDNDNDAPRASPNVVFFPRAYVLAHRRYSEIGNTASATHGGIPVVHCGVCGTLVPLLDYDDHLSDSHADFQWDTWTLETTTMLMNDAQDALMRVRRAEGVDAVLRKVDPAEVAADMGEDDLCPICLGSLLSASGVVVRVAICDHAFCAGCIRRWLEKGRHCPVCKRELLPEDQQEDHEQHAERPSMNHLFYHEGADEEEFDGWGGFLHEQDEDEDDEEEEEEEEEDEEEEEEDDDWGEAALHASMSFGGGDGDEDEDDS